MGNKRLSALLSAALAMFCTAAGFAEETCEPVKPGGIDGRPFWNRSSSIFMYPPSFDFPAIENAAKYRYIIEDDERKEYRFEEKTPIHSLAPIWSRLPTGFLRLEVLAINKSGRTIGQCGYRKFWKSAAFKAEEMPKRVSGFGEAAARYFDWLFSMENTQSYLKKGVPDEDYPYNAYPSKIDAALVNACIEYAKLRPDRAEDAMTVAKRAADHLLSLRLPHDSPLAHFTPTYRILSPSRPFAADDAQPDVVARKYSGQNMIVYPARAGLAFLNLHAATKDMRYMDAAVKIAQTYERLQGEDGTWHLKLCEKTGKPTSPNRMIPLAVCDFLERLYADTGNVRYREMSDRAFAYMEKGPLSDWNWEAQFEDVEPARRYRNLTVHPPVSAALHLLRRYPNDAERRELARECLRFAEDQFVLWKNPFRADGSGPLGRDTSYFPRATKEKWFEVPGVCEQFDWYLPIDSAAAKMIRGYLAFYRLERKNADLEKARALGAAITIMQAKHNQNGAIPTHWIDWEVGKKTNPWINCGIGTANALALLESFSQQD